MTWAGRQGAVEAFLDYPDGRRGAFEVTWLATDGGKSLQLQSLLRSDGFGLPSPGKWWWTIEISTRPQPLGSQQRRGGQAVEHAEVERANVPKV